MTRPAGVARGARAAWQGTGASDESASPGRSRGQPGDAQHPVTQRAGSSKGHRPKTGGSLPGSAWRAVTNTVDKVLPARAQPVVAVLAAYVVPTLLLSKPALVYPNEFGEQPLLDASNCNLYGMNFRTPLQHYRAPGRVVGNYTMKSFTPEEMRRALYAEGLTDPLVANGYASLCPRNTHLTYHVIAQDRTAIHIGSGLTTTVRRDDHHVYRFDDKHLHTGLPGVSHKPMKKMPPTHLDGAGEVIVRPDAADHRYRFHDAASPAFVTEIHYRIAVGYFCAPNHPDGRPTRGFVIDHAGLLAATLVAGASAVSFARGRRAGPTTSTSASTPAADPRLDAFYMNDDAWRLAAALGREAAAGGSRNADQLARDLGMVNRVRKTAVAELMREKILSSDRKTFVRRWMSQAFAGTESQSLM